MGETMRVWGVWFISVPSAQFRCEPKTTVQNKVYLKKVLKGIDLALMCLLLSVPSPALFSCSEYRCLLRLRSRKPKSRDGGTEKLEGACVFEGCSWAAAPALDSLFPSCDMRKRKLYVFKSLLFGILGTFDSPQLRYKLFSFMHGGKDFLRQKGTLRC